jgi:hypothetical protein
VGHSPRRAGPGHRRRRRDGPAEAVIGERPIERLPGYRSAGREELARSADAAAVVELVVSQF